MSTSLVIAGAVFEGAGLGLVFIELAVIRSHEFAEPTPWARLAARMRRLLRRPRNAHVTVSDSITLADSVRAKARPAAAAEDATEGERIARLERYVEHLDRDVDQLHRRIDAAVADASRTLQEREHAVREEMDRREEERRRALRPSLRRQAVGAVCVLVGLVLGTIGNVV